MGSIRITASRAGVSVSATLNESATARKIQDALPITGEAQRWGDEVYFEIPVQMGEEDPQASVEPGAIAYWPPGRAFCIFFGQTPYSAVNVVGKVDGDAREFGQVKDGDAVVIERA